MATIHLSQPDYNAQFDMNQEYPFNHQDMFYGEDGIHEAPQYDSGMRYGDGPEFTGSEMDRHSLVQDQPYINPGTNTTAYHSQYPGALVDDRYDLQADVNPPDFRYSIEPDEYEGSNFGQYPNQSLSRSDKFGKSVNLYQPDSPDDLRQYDLRDDFQMYDNSNHGSIEPLVMKSSTHGNFGPPDAMYDAPDMTRLTLNDRQYDTGGYRGSTGMVVSPPQEQLDVGGLITLLVRINDSNFDTGLVVNICAYLTHVTCRNEANKQAIFNNRGIQPLMALIRKRNPPVYTGALNVLRNLAYSDDMNIRLSICRAGSSQSPTQGLLDLKDLLESLEPLYDLQHTQRVHNPDLESLYELITGVIWNLSACKEVKLSIIQTLVDSLVTRVMMPCSGLEKNLLRDNQSEIVTHDLPVRWSTVLNFTVGIIRNVSSSNDESRHLLRNKDGLVESLITIVQSALNENCVDNKTVEHCVCTLRNLSYALQVIVDPTYCVRIDGHLNDHHSKNCSCCAGKSAHANRYQNRPNPHQPKRQNANKGSNGVANGSAPAGNHENQVYAAPRLKVPGAPRGEELLWQVSILDVYLHVMKDCNNPHTLEAAVGAVQNLSACEWQPSIDIRRQLRNLKGLVITVDLLSTNNDAVVRTSSTALRNLAVDPRNRDLLGTYSIDHLVKILPRRPDSSQSPTIMDSGYSLDTLASVLATLYVIVVDNESFSKKFRDCGGDERCRYIESSTIFVYNDPNMSIHDKERVQRFARILMKEVDANISGRKNTRSALLCSSCAPKKKDQSKQSTDTSRTLRQPALVVPSEADRASSYQNGGTIRSNQQLLHDGQKFYASEGPPSYNTYDNEGLTVERGNTLRSHTGSHGVQLSMPGSAQRSYAGSQLPSKQGTLRSNMSHPVQGVDNYGYTGSRSELVLNVDDIPLQEAGSMRPNNGYREYYGNYVIQDDINDPVYAQVDREAKYSMRQSVPPSHQGSQPASYQLNHYTNDNSDSWV